MNLHTQILKGVLEGCILAVIKQGPVYGYELSMILGVYGLVVSEGSIYPVLLRLQKEKLIRGELRASPSGTNRKYYFLTPEGEEALQNFQTSWEELKTSVDRLLKEEI